MKLKNAFKKLMMIIVTFAVLLTSFPINLLAAPVDTAMNNGDIKDAVNYVGSLNEPGDVLFTKTISKTETEGEYEVKLEVKGKDVTTISQAIAPVYAVVVFDRSASMDETTRKCVKYNRFGWCTKYEYISKWNSAVNGAKSFASNLLLNITTSNIALVTFANDAYVARGFENKDFQNNVSFGTPNGGTNLHAGLIKANELLSSNTIPSDAKKYVVIISDGEPTFYIKDNEVEGPGNKTNKDVYDNTLEVANSIKGYAEIFSIGYQLPSGIVYDSLTAEGILRNMATEDEYGSYSHYYNSDPDKVASAFNDIAGIITQNSPAGTNSVVIDTLGDAFEIVDDSFSSTPTSINGDKLTFNVGDITEEGTTITFNIKLKDNLLPGLYDTNDVANDGVKLSYIDANGNETSQVIKTISNSAEVYYNPDYNYVVEYYKDDQIINTVPGSAKYGETKDYEEQNITGYEVLKVTDYQGDILQNQKLIISNDESKNVMKVYYVPKKYAYYYKFNYAGTLDDSLTKEEQADYGSTIEINMQIFKEKYGNYGDKLGYVFEKFDPDKRTITDDLSNNVINVCYKKGNFKYTIRHNYEDNIVEEEINEAEFEKEFELDDIKKVIDGYRYNNASSTKLIITANEDENIINLYYKKNNYGYRVEYYYDGLLDESKTYGLSALFGDKITTYKDKSEGYNLDKVEELTISSNEDNNVLRVYYVKPVQEIKEIEQEYIVPPKTGVNIYSSLIIIGLLLSALVIKLRKLI